MHKNQHEFGPIEAGAFGSGLDLLHASRHSPCDPPDFRQRTDSTLASDRVGAGAHLFPQRRTGDEGRDSHAAGGLVLVVDDDADLRNAVASLLLDEGYDVHAAESGDQALQWLHQTDRTPSVILTDLMMPGVSGWELVRRLRADDRFLDTPVLVTSSLEKSAAPAGIDGFMRKPIDVDRMLSLIRCHCGYFR